MSYDFWQYKLNKLYKPLVKYYIQEYSKVLDSLANDTDRDQLIWRFSDFFSLYFSNGDFWYFKNKFSSYEYRIPYSGKDTEFRWATKDCYYVKTSDVVNDMQVDLGSLFEGKQWTLKLFKKTRSESDSSGNEVFRFDVQIEDIVDEETDELTWYSVIFYNYEEDKSIKTKQKDDKIAEVLLTKGIRAKDPAVSKTLWDFLTKRGRDYFIHKRLKTFLNEELEWYFFQLLKHDIQGKVDILTLQNKIAEIKLKYQDDQEVIDMKIAKLMSESGSLSGNNYQLAYIWILNFINILADLEEFKAKVWNKERKVIKQEYCISLSKIPTEYHSEVLGNSAQQQERKDLGMTAGTNGLFTEDQALVVDTKHYSWAIREKLLHLAQSQEVTGRLIKSDNYQALQWMQKEYTNQIKCIYIDPPYNTDSAPIAYKNWYKSSSWVSMMNDRLDASKRILSETWIICVAIDDVESNNLSKTLDVTYGSENYLAQITVLCNPQWRVADYVSKTSDFHYVFAKDINYVENISIEKRDSTKKDVPLKRTWTNSRRTERPRRYYPILYKDGKLSCIEKEEYDLIYNKDKWFNDNYLSTLQEKYEWLWFEFILPKLENWTELVWQRTYDRVSKEITTYSYRNGTIYSPSFEEEIPKTSRVSNLYSNPQYWTNLLKDILWYSRSENTPKSIYTVTDFILLAEKASQTILDFFAWSWTTWHAVLKLNKDWEERKFILVELGKYFDDVTLKRIKKVMYSDNRKDGTAVDNNGSQVVVQYLYLNQYEDRFADDGYLKTLEWEINTLAQTEVTTQTDIKHILHPLRELLDKIYTIDDHL